MANGNRSRRKASVKTLGRPPLSVTYPLATLPPPLPLTLCNFLFLFCLRRGFSSTEKKSRSQAEKPIVRSLDFSGFFFFITGCSSLWRRVSRAQCICMYVCVCVVCVVCVQLDSQSDTFGFRRESVCWICWRQVFNGKWDKEEMVKKLFKLFNLLGIIL